MSKGAYLVTGGPGTGKTTLIKQAVAGFGGKVGGFYTEEIRYHGIRQGFRIVTFQGPTAPLAHVDFPGPLRVAKYGVDVESLDRVGVKALNQALEESDLVVIDEIGKMELFSPSFRQAILQALGAEKKVLGTIMLKPHPFADEIKRHPQVHLLMLTRLNFREVLGEVQQWLGSHK